MPKRVSINAKLYLAQFNLSGFLNQASLKYGASLHAAATFPDFDERDLAGLTQNAIEMHGFTDYAAAGSDEAIDPMVGGPEKVFTLGPTTGAVGEIAYFGRTTPENYDKTEAHGNIAEFNFSAKGFWKVSRGFVLDNGTRTVTGNGTQVEVGAASSTQKIYAALHVLAVSGVNPTLDVIIQSDTTGFPTPVTKITFGQKTAVGSEYATPVAGPNTDTFYRVSVTIGGTGSPSFTFVVVVAVQ